MKVLHVIPSISERSGGPGQAILPMCRALHNRGVEVVLASTGADSKGVSEFNYGRKKTDKGLPVILFPKQLGASFKYSRPFSIWLQANVSGFDLVHIHAVFNHACVAAARACRKQGLPYVVRPLGTLDPWSMKQKSFRKRVFWHAGIKKMLRGAAAVHYTTQDEQHAVEESLKLSHGFVVPLGIEIKPLDKSLAVKDLAQHFPTLLEHPYVLVLSRLHPKKALETLLHAFISLTAREEFSEWRLVIAGDGDPAYVKSLKRIVAGRHGEAFVHFTGWLENERKEAILRMTELVALPSRQENFGLCIAEAMACGVPVLVSPHVNLAPEIEAARAGWIAEVDKTALEQALATALSSKEERLTRGGNGKQLALNYAWPNIANQLRQRYSEIIPNTDESMPAGVHHA